MAGMSKSTRTARPVPTDEHGQLVFDVFAKNCPSRFALEDVTSRWGTLALAALNEGEARFGVLRRKVDGVSEKMLAQTLQALERDGLVYREAQATIPPRVDYGLTPLGREIAGLVVGLIERLELRAHRIIEHQQAYDQAKAAAAGSEMQ
jgi:DNA-binding HxlR family transcriptional regulator